jgi:hypothetical protein
MLETPSMQQYDENRENLFAADNQQGRPEMEPSTTKRTAPRKRKNTHKRYTDRKHAKCEGYVYDESKKVWVRHTKGNCVWCMDCNQWKPIEFFANVNGKPYSYCKECQRIHKAMSRYHLNRQQVIELYSQTTCICCGCEFEKQTHQHIHHIDNMVIGLVCLRCNHTLRDESPEHLHRLLCCVRFIESRMKI